MQPFSDLNAILQDGYSFTQDKSQGIFRVPKLVTMSIHQAGELILSSGKIIVCDPLIGIDLRYHLKKTIKPGCYPVQLSVADFQPNSDPRIACAMVRFTDEATVKWEVATITDPNPNQKEEMICYGVDAGTGCFIDWDAAQTIEDQFSELEEFEGFCDQIITTMEKNSVGKHVTGGWANVRVNEATGANIIAFSSGWGDGGYASFWGYDASGNITSLVTDFDLFSTDEAQ